MSTLYTECTTYGVLSSTHGEKIPKTKTNMTRGLYFFETIAWELMGK
jgi:hypothetical protein